MIQGEYDYGDHVFIDSKYTYDQSDVIFHELTHHAVTQGSLYGVLEIVLKRISIWHIPELTSVISELSNASLTAQEMSAIYAQCLYYKRQGGETLAAYEKYLHQSDYYCILRSLADSDAFQSGRCAEHNGRPETLAIIN